MMTSTLIQDKELAPQIGVTRSFLQKDRRTKQQIPFYRIGKLALYDVEEVREALKQSIVGGPKKKKK